MGYAILDGYSDAARLDNENLSQRSAIDQAISKPLADIIISPDGLDLRGLSARMRGLGADHGNLNIAISAACSFPVKSIKNLLFQISCTPLQADPTLKLSDNSYRPTCGGLCWGEGYQVPVRDGRGAAKETFSLDAASCSSPAQISLKERDAAVPLELQLALGAMADRLDYLRGHGELDHIVKMMTPPDHFHAVQIQAHIYRNDRLMAVVPIDRLTPYGWQAGYEGQEMVLMSSRWEQSQYFRQSPAKSALAYCKPCSWCSGTGIIENRPWRMLSWVYGIGRLIYITRLSKKT